MSNRNLKLAHILLVEDNEGDILLTLDAFEESKFKSQVSVARNGKEALAFLKKQDEYSDAQEPDLILLDINIPIFSGHEVLKEIKQDEKLRNIPVLMLTTSSNQEDIEKAYNNYCNSYIQKPLEMEKFMQAVLKIEEFWLQLTTLAK